MPFLVFRRDHLRSNLGISSGLGIICGRESFAALYTHTMEGGSQTDSGNAAENGFHSTKRKNLDNEDGTLTYRLQS